MFLERSKKRSIILDSNKSPPELTPILRPPCLSRKESLPSRRRVTQLPLAPDSGNLSDTHFSCTCFPGGEKASIWHWNSLSKVSLCLWADSTFLRGRIRCRNTLRNPCDYFCLKFICWKWNWKCRFCNVSPIQCGGYMYSMLSIYIVCLCLYQLICVMGKFLFLWMNSEVTS